MRVREQRFCDNRSMALRAAFAASTVDEVEGYRDSNSRQ
jgi:hypothetical protein